LGARDRGDGAVTDERKAFEEWIVTAGYDYTCTARRGDGYAYEPVDSAYRAWQARASTAAVPVAQAPTQSERALTIATRALKNIEHATAPTPNDDGYHEAAYTLAHQALSDMKWGTVGGAALRTAEDKP
jgi:hypothetical protein